MAPATRNPANWDDYDGRPLFSGSFASSALGEEQALLDDDNGAIHASGLDLSHRRSSFSNRLAAVADIGGVNSFRSFARSWQRAAGFPEVIPRRPSFVYASDHDAEQLQYGRSHVDSAAASQPRSGLLRQHLEAASQHSGEPSTASYVSSHAQPRDSFRERESKALGDDLAAGAPHSASPSSLSSIFAVPPHLAVPSIIGSYGSHHSSQYGTMDRTMRHRISLDQEAGLGGGDIDNGPAHGEHAPVLVKEVKQGDKVVLAVEGQSTLPQSVFNSINSLIGVGLLSLPLALKLSGWVCGLSLMTLIGVVTSHTGKLLAKCMDYDPTLITYSDIAYVSFGPRARIVVSALFTLELLSACVALVILFADSLNLLMPDLASVNIWKFVAAGLILVLNAMPLRFLSYTSIIGILSTFCIVVIVVIDGAIKPDFPGSLHEPAKTYLAPTSWLALPLAYGLLASPWGAHSVFPSIYRDMRHPYKWKKAMNVTFSFSYILDACLACVGVLMFGDEIHDAITSNVLSTKGYPRGLIVTMCVFVAVIPLTKIPLNARPIITTMDILLGVHDHTPNKHHEDEQHQQLDEGEARKQYILKHLIRAVVRAFVVVLLLFISIMIPAFDAVCAILGAALCTLISIILPISFHLKLFWKDISLKEKVISWITLVVFGILGLLGTVWTFLPKHLIGAD